MENKKIRNVTVTSGGSYTASGSSVIQRIILDGTVTLTSNFSIIPGVTQTKGMFIIIENNSDVTLSGGEIVLFGTSIPANLNNTKWIANCLYTGSDWDIKLTPDFLGTNIVDTANIVDAAVTSDKIKGLAVTLDKIQAIPRGFMIAGNSSDVADTLNCKEANTLLCGDGTDVLSLPFASSSPIQMGITANEISLTPDDGAILPIKIQSSIAGNGLAVDGDGVLSVKDDTINGTSIVSTSDGVRLDGDATTPGVDKYYGTDSSGIKGFFDIPGGTLTNISISDNTLNAFQVRESSTQYIAIDTTNGSESISLKNALVELDSLNIEGVGYCNISTPVSTDGGGVDISVTASTATSSGYSGGNISFTTGKASGASQSGSFSITISGNDEDGQTNPVLSTEFKTVLNESLYIRRTHFQETLTIVDGDATLVTTQGVPVNAKIVCAAFKSVGLITMNGGGTSYSLAYTGGQNIGSGYLISQSNSEAKFYDENADSAIVTVTDQTITFTPNAGTFKSGAFSVMVIYDQLIYA